MDINTKELPLIVDRLRQSNLPIVLYGMGNGGDKVLDFCESSGIKVSAVFASDSFVRNKVFRGFPVMSYSEVKEKFGEDMIVLLSFATSRPEVLENIYKIAGENTLLAPDVPAFGDTVFTSDFYEKNRDSFEKVYSLLYDDRSRELFSDVIKYKLTGEIKYLEKTDNEQDYMENIIFSSKIKHFVDAGAYKGDTAERQMKLSPNLQSIIAIEPDPKTYAKMCDTLRKFDEIELITVNSGLWDENTSLPFNGDGGRGGTATLGKGNKIAEFRTLDSIVCERAVDYIKYDVEGAEYRALLGSRETIVRNRPKLLVSIYHRSEDLFELPLLVNELLTNSKMFLRRLPGIPAWDLNLLVIPE